MTTPPYPVGNLRPTLVSRLIFSNACPDDGQRLPDNQALSQVLRCKQRGF